MSNRLFAAAAAAALATAGAAAQQASAPAQTVQQQFDAAGAALEAEDWAEALRILEALERRLGPNGHARSLAVVRVRKAQALLRLGRLDEATAALRTSLPALPADDPSLYEDRFRSFVALGRIAELRLDYRDAAAQYRAAAAISVEPVLRLGVYRGLIQTLMFYDPNAALAAADEALRIVAEAAPGERELEGQFRTSRGRVLLNMGRFAEARDELERATRRLGGLGLQVNLRDLIARSDLAIAALLAGDDDGARRYLALTGAGTMREAALPPVGRMPPPRCGDGLSPDDVAVVELAIRDDGTVAAATPVYASTRGDSAVRFARAALVWTWLPEQVQRVEPIFRTAVRVELRCTLSPSLASPVAPHDQQESDAWAAARAIPIELTPARNLTEPQMRADLASAEARHGAQSPQVLRPLMRLASRDDVPAHERVDMLRRAAAIARAAQAPSAYVATIARSLAEARHEAADRGFDTPPDYLALLEDPGFAGDPHVAVALHLAAADRMSANGRLDDAAAVLARAQGIAGIAAGDPLRARIAERVAAVEMARGNADAAAAAWRSFPDGTLTCPVRPTLLSGRGTNRDFPNEALAWGFEGWAMSEAQVGADGRPQPVRTVTSYPPFVFSRATERMIARFRFAPAFAPGGRACATFNQRVIYRLPDRRDSSRYRP